jgi:hypothetical protein
VTSAPRIPQIQHATLVGRGDGQLGEDEREDEQVVYGERFLEHVRRVVRDHRLPAVEREHNEAKEQPEPDPGRTPQRGRAQRLRSRR